MKKMFKTVMTLLLVTSAGTLTGCGTVKGLEKNASVVLVNGDRVVSSYTINIFSNALIGGIDESAVPEGQEFLGWSTKSDWTFGVDSVEELYPAESLIRYNDVKDQIVDNVFKLTAAFGEKQVAPAGYLVIGWYAKTATSGLDDKIIANFTVALNNYVKAQGATEAEIATIAVRPYDGAVADMGTAVNKDGDVDLLIGVGNNIDTTGGVQVIEKIGDIPMGAKSRYIARLSEKEIAVAVYQWLQTPEAQESLK